MKRVVELIVVCSALFCLTSSAQTLYWNHPKGAKFTTPVANVQVAHLKVPAGYYLVTFKARADFVLSGYQAELFCSLYKSDFNGPLDSTHLANGVDSGGVEFFAGTILMHNEFHTNGADIRVLCSAGTDQQNGTFSSGDSITIGDTAMSALKVSTVVLQ